MAMQGRRFGKPHPLQEVMRRGEMFFDAITSTDIDEVLTRSKRIGKIAFTAATIAGEKLQLEGDGDSKRLIFAAYLNIGDLVQTIADNSSTAEARDVLSSDQTYKTLLLASGALNSIGFGRTITQFRRQGAYFDVDGNDLLFDDHAIPKSYEGSGCPYAKGNVQRAEYFKDCTDHIVSTYIQARGQDMPHNLRNQISRHILRTN